MRPGKIDKIRVRWSLHFPLPGYFSVTLFGRMWIRVSKKVKWDYYKRTGKADIMLNHEMIHVKQAISTGDSWCGFYARYLLEWLKANPFLNGFSFAHHMNPFEIEAYANEGDMTYNTVNYDGAEQWKELSKISIGDRKRLWRLYRSKKNISFSAFVKTYVLPELVKID